MPSLKPMPTRCLLTQTAVPVRCQSKPFIPTRLQNYLPILLQSRDIPLSVGQRLRTAGKSATIRSRLKWVQSRSPSMPCGKPKSIPFGLMQTVEAVKLFHKTLRQTKPGRSQGIPIPVRKKDTPLQAGRLRRMVQSFMRIRQAIPWEQSHLTRFMRFGNWRITLFPTIYRAVSTIHKTLLPIR